MRTTMATTITTIVETAVARFCRMRVPVARDDLMQEGMAVALDTQRRYPDKADKPEYVYGAVTKSLGNFVSAQMCVASVPRSMLDGSKGRNKGKDIQRVPMEALEGMAAPSNPEDDLLDAQEQQLMRQWRMDLREYVEDNILPKLSDQKRDIIERLYGWRGLAPQRHAHIADDLGCPVEAVYHARHTLLRILRDNLAFYGFQQQLKVLKQS